MGAGPATRRTEAATASLASRRHAIIVAWRLVKAVGTGIRSPAVGVTDLSLQSRRSAVQQQSYGTSQMARAVLPWPTLARLTCVF